MAKKIKVALVHDYLMTFGGAERVLLALHEIWPEAPVFVSLVDEKRMGRWWRKFSSWDIRPSWFQKVPFASSLISPLRFLLPLIWESFDLSGFDVVISSSAWGICKGVITSPESKHFCYCHTPPRFLYGYSGGRRWLRFWPVRVYSRLVNHWLRFYDQVTASRVDFFVANSQEVAKRIAKFWRRKAVVINPPVDIPSSLPQGQKRGPFLYVGRLVAYKHPDWAVKACGERKEPLVVIGDGPLRQEVERLAKQYPTVKVLGVVSDRELHQWYRRCRALIFPVEDEDFGIVPLEAQGFGKPVIAYFSGGAKETIKKDKTGIFFYQPRWQSLEKALAEFEKKEKEFSPQVIYRWAKQFSKEAFQRKIKRFVEENINA